jgi:hypothetical protein
MNTVATRQVLLLALAGILFSIVAVGQTQRDGHQDEQSPAFAELPLRASTAPEVLLVPPTTTISTTPPAPQSAAAKILPMRPLQTSVEVNAKQQTLATGLSAPYNVTAGEVLSSAGTWGDFSRYLQLLPGAVGNSDMSNDVLVRGGNPSENLYVVDGIEVPNINHIAVEGTTGGFVSMIDTSTIGSVDMNPGPYEAQYSSRLSSLIEVRTLDGPNVPMAREADLGISGAGGFIQRSLGPNAGLLLAAHRSVLNLVTNDIGLNGVPIYTDGMARWQWSPDERDRLSALSLDGADSIDITPEPCDDGETLRVQTQYEGSRFTDGMVWQHLHSASAVSSVTASYSTQNQNIGQQLQTTTYANTPSCFSAPIASTPLYMEQTHDGIATLSYGLQLGRRGWLYSAGTTGRLVALDYQVVQPLGQQSPFNANPAWTDADSFARRLTTGQTGVYVEALGSLGKRWTLIAGAREETFALTGAHAFDPRASLGFRISGHQTLNATYNRSSQLAPTIDLLSYPGNARLKPLEVEQFSAVAEVWRGARTSVSLEAYRKRYGNEPVSTEYPSLMLANMVDTLGQQFVWLPLANGGRGRTEGIEFLLRAHTAQRLQLLGSVSYSRTLYAAADGVMRPGNFDFPLVGNSLVNLKLPLKCNLAVRNTYASGRPYTPFNIPLSEEQSRGIYDLTRVNAMRGPAYNRIDVDFHRIFQIHRKPMTAYAGVENALNRQNFLGMAWEDNCGASPGAMLCGESVNAEPGVPETEIKQMSRFPSAGIRYSF